jgi:hypothetical protein
MCEKFTLTKVRQQQIIVVYETNTSLVHKLVIIQSLQHKKLRCLPTLRISERPTFRPYCVALPRIKPIYGLL